VIGTLLNVGTVVAGGITGSLIGGRLPERLRETLVVGIGLMTLAIGAQMALTMTSPVLVLISLLLGGALGALVRLDERIDRFGDKLQRLARGRGGHVSEAFVSTSLIFCIGPMTVLGSIQDGLTGNFQLLTIKSTLDGITALAYASSLGPGVLLSALTILLYQGALTVASGAAKSLLSDAMIAAMTAVGGVMILGLGLEILQLKRVKVANFLPSLVIAPLAVLIQLAAG
jgi:uncharacterized membrane protein YqgA involved in biofilm formation